MGLQQGRKLGYPEDALIAFSGITDKLSKRFAGGFISGLLQLFFDVALHMAASTSCKAKRAKDLQWLKTPVFQAGLGQAGTASLIRTAGLAAGASLLIAEQ